MKFKNSFTARTTWRKLLWRKLGVERESDPLVGRQRHQQHQRPSES